MDKYTEEEIKFKIMGENKTNEILNAVVPELLEVFKGLEETQILKSGYSVTSGELLKKYKVKTDEILKEYTNNYTNEEITPLLYLKASEYSLILEIKIRFDSLKVGGFLYYDGYKYILNLRDGLLKEIYEFKEIEPINEDQQINKVKSALNLLGQLEKIKSELKPYSLTDLIKTGNI